MPVFTSRRAERFAQLLDEATGTRRHHVRSTADGEVTGLVAIGQRVSTLPLVAEVDPEFRSGLRASLMAHIEREGIGVTAVTSEPDVPVRVRRKLLPSTRTRVAILGTLAAGTLAISGVSAASGSAIPGDTLYGVKRSSERAQLAFAGSDVSRGQLYLEFAKVRLGEANAVGNDAAKLDPVLDDLDVAMRNGSRLLTTSAVTRGEAAALQAIEQFAAQQRPHIEGLTTRVNGPAHLRALESLALLDRIAKRAHGLRSVVNCPGQDINVDDLGAVPTMCGKPNAQQQQPNQHSPGGGTTEATPQPTGPNTERQTAEPAGTPPSVEASVPGVTGGVVPPVPAPSGPIRDTVDQLIENLVR